MNMSLVLKDKLPLTFQNIHFVIEFQKPTASFLYQSINILIQKNYKCFKRFFTLLKVKKTIILPTLNLLNLAN